MLNWIKIIIHIAVLYGVFIIGNWIQRLLHLFIPGSVIGMILLFVLLMTGVMKVGWIEEGAKFIVKHLSLFFIPVTVGVMSYFTLFSGKGFLLIVIVLLSTVLVMASSGLMSQLLAGKERGRSHD